MSAFSDKAKTILASIAPELGLALGGPFGGMAGAALAKALGTKGSDDPASDAAIASGNPDVLLKIKEANDTFKLQMEQLGITRDQLAYADTANARAREMTVRDWTPRILAYGVVLATALVEGYAMLHGLPAKVDMVIAGRVLGTLDSATMLVLGYYFGTSISSRAKDETISTMASAASQ